MTDLTQGIVGTESRTLRSNKHLGTSCEFLHMFCDFGLGGGFREPSSLAAEVHAASPGETKQQLLEVCLCAKPSEPGVDLGECDLSSVISHIPHVQNDILVGPGAVAHRSEVTWAHTHC